MAPRVVLVNCILASFAVVFVSSLGMDNMVAKGTWLVLDISRCANHDDYEFDFDIKRSKLNRTHDGFSAYLKLAEDIPEDFAMRADVCKYVEGGCKDYQVVSDDSFCRFIKKYAEDNVKSVLSLIGVDPPDCPIPKGDYELNDYTFNYEELPTDGLPGKFTALIYLLKQGGEVACLSMTVEFIEEDDDGGDDDE